MEDLHSIGFDEIAQAFALKKDLEHRRDRMYLNSTHEKNSRWGWQVDKAECHLLARATGRSA